VADCIHIASLSAKGVGKAKGVGEKRKEKGDKKRSERNK
jgi:hypothetical protein